MLLTKKILASNKGRDNLKNNQISKYKNQIGLCDLFLGI
jgi:hypothetical protein